MTGPIRVLELTGSPYDIGYQHGATYKDMIRSYAEDRVHLVMEGAWTGGAKLSRSEVLEVAAACLPDHNDFSLTLFEELEGLAAATELSLAELVIVGGFTDFIDVIYSLHRQQGDKLTALPVDDCTAFIVPDSKANGAGFFGQTWDMHDTATEYVILLDIKPDNGPRAIVFSTTGCVGQLGMNEHGIAIGINNLMAADGQIGVTWPFVVRKVLMQDNMDDALACITDAKLAGGHSYLLFDRTGRGYNIEAMSTATYIEELEDVALVHTNHCLVPRTLEVAQKRPPASQASSENRLNLAIEVLSKPGDISEFDLMNLLAAEPTICVSSSPPFHIETCGAALMRPTTGDLWAVWGKPSQHPFEHFTL